MKVSERQNKREGDRCILYHLHWCWLRLVISSFLAECYWLLQRLCAMLYYQYTKMKCSKRKYAKINIREHEIRISLHCSDDAHWKQCEIVYKLELWSLYQRKYGLQTCCTCTQSVYERKTECRWKELMMMMMTATTMMMVMNALPATICEICTCATIYPNRISLYFGCTTHQSDVCGVEQQQQLQQRLIAKWHAVRFIFKTKQMVLHHSKQTQTVR